MKRILSVLIICLILVSTLTACGSDTILFSGVNFSKYVDLGEYTGIEVDTSSDTLKGYYKDEILGDIASKNLYVKITEGKVKDGDTVYIDYVGKKDGVAFEGGTAKNYPLTIGSGSFIDGFEDGLIGVEIGSTVDLNLKFPENYGNEELNGAAVVFTVKVNYVSTTEQRKPEEYYSDLGFKTLKNYEDDVWVRAIKQYLIETLYNDSEIKGYPEKATELIYAHNENLANNAIKNQYGVDLETFVTGNGISMETYKNNIITNEIEPEIEVPMIYYYILENENIKITSKMLEERITKEANIINEEKGYRDLFIEQYGKFSVEMMIAKELALDFMYDNAKIK